MDPFSSVAAQKIYQALGLGGRNADSLDNILTIIDENESLCDAVRSKLSEHIHPFKNPDIADIDRSVLTDIIELEKEDCKNNKIKIFRDGKRVNMTVVEKTAFNILFPKLLNGLVDFYLLGRQTIIVEGNLNAGYYIEPFTRDSKDIILLTYCMAKNQGNAIYDHNPLMRLDESEEVPKSPGDILYTAVSHNQPLCDAIINRLQSIIKRYVNADGVDISPGTGQILIENTIKECKENIIQIGCNGSKVNMKEDEKTAFITLFSKLLLPLVQFYNKGHMKTLVEKTAKTVGYYIETNPNNPVDVCLTCDTSYGGKVVIPSIANLSWLN